MSHPLKTTTAFHPVVDVVVPPGRIEPGTTVAHLRVTGSVRRHDRPAEQRFFGWPACQPRHEHPCASQDTDDCETECRCGCDCDLPRWIELQAARAMALGVIACPQPACTAPNPSHDKD